MILKHGTMIF